MTLPKEYAPKEVIKMLNGMKNDIYAVRGNCEAESGPDGSGIPGNGRLLYSGN